MKFRYLPLILVAGFTSFNSFADAGCGGASADSGLVCANDFDMEAVATEADEAAKESKSTTQEVFNKISKKASEAKEELASSGCLNGLLGLNFDAQLIDPSNLQMLQILEMVKKFITDSACAAAVELTNAKVKETDAQIDAAGEMIGEKSMGLAEGGSKTTRDGSFGGTSKVTAIQDSKLMEDVTKDVNKKVNQRFFNEDNPFDGKNKIDFTDSKSYEEGASTGSKKDGVNVGDYKELYNELEKGAVCFFSEEDC